MIGAAGNRPRLVEPLSDFVRRARIPFFNTQMGKGAVTGSSDLYIGTAALSERDYIHEAIDEADLIVAIGHDTVEKPPFLAGAQRDRKLIHVGYLPASVEQVFYPDAELVGDIGASVAALAARLDGRIMPGAALGALREGILHGSTRAPTMAAFRSRRSASCTMCASVDAARTGSSASTTACTRSGSRATTAPTSPTRCCSTTRSRPWARACRPRIMAQLLYPGRRVLAVCGDGGFMMNSQELETAVRLGLDLVVLIIDDDAYGMIRWKQAVDGFPDFGMTFGNPDFVKYAEAYGACGHQVRAAEELAPDARGSVRRPAACISSLCPSTTARTFACWSRSSRAREPRCKASGHD